MFKVIIGVLLATGVSFVIAAPIVRMAGERSLEAAQGQVAAMKAESKGQAVSVPANEKLTDSTAVKKIIFACDAGMGSSAMGATKFRNRIKDVRPDIKVTNTSVDNIPGDCDIAVVQTTLAARAKKSAPQAQLIFGIAGIGDEHLDLLAKLCTMLEDEERLEILKTTKDVDWVLEQLS